MGYMSAGLFWQGLSHLWDKGQLEKGKGVPGALGEGTSGQEDNPLDKQASTHSG